MLVTADIFPSYILEPKKIIDNITWFLNPLEEPPQKFLQILPASSKENIYSDLLEKEGFIIENILLENLQSGEKGEILAGLQKHRFNIVFSLANEKIFQNFESVAEIIHDLLRPSSYFILEVKISHNQKEIEKILLQNFGTVNFLTPWSDLATNPFSPFDENQQKYCWVVALSQASDEDPAEWMNYL